ncbi:MAG: UPF0182 family protein [Firmicutes bacterium]|jgi:uncharacterized membrane protein (UPF0182 family)|nr:UPF0182 family protein [Bacillota bacterium]MDH7496064.1 UPF0182 family protein [Bacillota bacterium]
MVRRYVGLFVVALVVGTAASLRGIATFFTDILWFREVGYLQALWVPVLSRLALGFVIGAVFFVFVFVNLRLTEASIRRSASLSQQFGIPAHIVGQRVRVGFLILSTTLAVLVGLGSSSHWMVVQQFLHRAPAGVKDPLFALDIGFYLFVLPLYRLVYSLLMTLTVMTASLVTAIYVLTRTLSLGSAGVIGSPLARRHLIGLLTLGFLLKAWGYRLATIGLVYSPRGVTFGAGYTDVHAQMPALGILSAMAVVVGLLLLANLFVRAERLALGAIGAMAIASFLLGTAYPAVVQRLSVEPNELSREQPYIKYNVDATRAAFGLDAIEVQPFSVRNDLSFSRLMTVHRDTVESIRLWDWRPLAQTYKQLQEFRVYYDFNDVDIDRYVMNGRPRQVALSARELSVGELPDQARTWVNERFVYTHGYGLAMSDVNEVSAEGLPRFVIQDIPPKSDRGFEVTRPEIYYGERTDDYVVVGTSAREFDYPTGEANVYTRYEGHGGVQVSSLLRKAAFAARFGSLKFLMSTDMTPESRVLYKRNIRDRVMSIAPFLLYDGDPYLVLADGKLFWIWDAYTVSTRYPYSQPLEDGINYIRNSVKVVIDAYNGDVEFYATSADEPILKSLSGVFPGMFRPLEQMPGSLKGHIRYPEDLFTIQARVLNAYHMTDAEAFYKREDFWDFPEEVYGGERQSVRPYYILMSTPGGTRPEFLLILPFTPSGKDNMIAWLAARNDPPHYGELVLYTFPKDQLVYGPMQVEARIDQDPAISEALTLWSQRGSRVVRGNLLVIPVENSILYVEPLYLLAERSELPELKRVIVAFGNTVAMDATLQGALASALGATPEGRRAAPVPEQAAQAPTKGAPDEADELMSDLTARAVRVYDEAGARLRAGDFAGFGESLAELGTLLRELEERAK